MLKVCVEKGINVWPSNHRYNSSNTGRQQYAGNGISCYGSTGISCKLYIPLP